MKFDPPLESAKLLKRYKRFFADMELKDGSVETAHCPNTGSMLNCLVERAPCYFSRSNNPKRKLKTTLEYVTCASGKLACINTLRANQIVKEALIAGKVKELAEYDEIATEVKYGEENSRIDFKLTSKARPDCFVEVKSVTLAEERPEGLVGYFPDAVTTRGQKHLRELAKMRNEGYRAVLFFCVQHQDIDRVRPATHIDPEYARLLVDAAEKGVELLAYQVRLSPDQMEIEKPLPVELDPN